MAFTIASGQSTVSVYYEDTVVGSPTVTMASGALANGTQPESVVAGGATQLVITSPARVFTAGACALAANVITVALEDSGSNGVTTGVVFTASSGSAGETWYTGTNCTGTTATGTMAFTIAAGQSTVSVYYEDTVVGSPVVTMASGILANGTQTQTVTARTATQLIITSPARVFTAGACALAANVITVALEDASNNGVTTG